MPIMFAMALLAASLPNAVVLRPVANMYSKPGTDADVVSQAIYGVNVEIVERQAGWARIRTADQYTGWTPLAELKPGPPYAVAGRVAQVDSLFAHLYREPDVTRHQPLLTIPFEARLELTSDPPAGERWVQVRLPDDRPAWVQRGDLDLAPQNITREAMLDLSRRFIGLPYTWGGTSTFGFDCSGFVQMLYRRHGLQLPRDAGPQARWDGLVPVDRKALRPGDLLYFGPSAEKITHTGLYIGEGRFINATTHVRPMVQISELEDAHWSRLLVACRRPR